MAKGIKVCSSWRKFENFFKDMGKKPTPQHSLDRINNAGNYEPGNCRWATRFEQANNKDNNRYLEINGERLTIANAARKFGLRPTRVVNRLWSGWTVKEALTIPLGNKRKKP